MLGETVVGELGGYQELGLRFRLVAMLIARTRSAENVSSRSNHRSDVLKVGSSAYEQSIYTAIDCRGNTGPRLQLWKQYVESAHLIPQIAHGAKS
nr:hypothetical protein Itr_chr11CG17040 [Ipomoea trifida]